jgi:lactoylglutathione lyase
LSAAGNQHYLLFLTGCPRAAINSRATAPPRLAPFAFMVAVRPALEHPERVRSLVLAEPPILPWLPDIPGGEGIEEGFMAAVWIPLAEAFHESDEAGLEFTSQWYFGVPFSEVSREWRILFANNVLEWRELTVSPLTFPKVSYDDVRALTVPTLLLSAGQNAGGWNDLIDGHLARLLPDVRRVIIPDASHEMFLDFPEVTARAMLDFFPDVTSAPLFAQERFDLQFDHTTVLVSNLETSSSFYENILRLETLETPWGPAAPVRFFSLGGSRQLHMGVANRMIEPDKNAHLAFAIVNFDEYLSFLRKEGVVYTNFPGSSSAPQVRPDGIRQIYLQDPDGNWIEINDAAHPERESRR